jgi:hypothetical protein
MISLSLVALGLSAACAIGLVGTMLRVRRIRREGLDLEGRIVTWSEAFASSHDQEVSILRRDIAAVQLRASDLEAALNRVRTAAGKTSPPQIVDPNPEYVDPPVAEEAPEVPPAADVRAPDVRVAVRSAGVRSADRGYLMQGQRHRGVDELTDTPSSSSSKARLYAGMPAQDGTFPAANVTPAADQWSLYEIDPDAGPLTKGTRARLLLYSATRIHGAALAGHREYLMPVCDYDPPPQTEHTTIKMAMPGQLCFDGEHWRQTRKMKIKFSV